MADEEVVSQPEKTEEVPRGWNGEIGEPTAALTIKQRYHHAHFKRVDAEDKHNPRRILWVRNEGAPSLKQFARKLADSGDVNAKDWFANKRGAKDQTRSDANVKAAREASVATKAERHKRSAGKNKK